MLRFSLLGLSAVGLLSLCSCDGDSSGGVALSGEVTFDGKPVPAGTIYFDPKGEGAQGVAQIVNGHYDTAKDGRPPPSGEVTVRIEGFSDSEPPKMLFKHQLEMTISESETTKTFEVPASAAKNVPKNVGPPA